MKVTVIGLGKIGLPLAVQFASMGVSTIGLDVNEETVRLVNNGEEPFPEEMDLQRRLANAVSSNLLNATSDAQEAISLANVIVVAVPLFVDSAGKADFRVIDSVTDQIAKYIQPQTLICFETTLPVGTTRNRFTRRIESISQKKVGEDFYVVFSPERVLTGRIFSDLRRYPKIVGGVTEGCALRGVEFYSKVLDFDSREDLSKPNGVWSVGSAEAAEFVKLAETTYRDVNIGLANQFSIFADEINVDIQKVINAANSQTYSHIHQPGISVGGHCIPIYPQFYLENNPTASIVRSAREVNWTMPDYYVDKLLAVDGELVDKSILVLGVSYRPNVKEVAFSGAYEIKKRLMKLGAKPKFLDPLYSSEELLELGFDPALKHEDFHFAIIHTAHTDYFNFDFSKYKKMKFVVDGRGCLGKGLGLVAVNE